MTFANILSRPGDTFPPKLGTENRAASFLLTHVYTKMFKKSGLHQYNKLAFWITIHTCISMIKKVKEMKGSLFTFSNRI